MKKLITFTILLNLINFSYSQTTYPENEIIQNLPTGIFYQYGPGAANDIPQWTYPYRTKLSISGGGGYRNFELSTTSYPNGDLVFRQWDPWANGNEGEWAPWRKLLIEDYDGGLNSLNINSLTASSLNINNTGDGAVLLDLQSERNWQFRQFSSGPGTALELKSIGGGGNKNFIISTNGKVGIGTTTQPNAKLEVNGDIHTKEVRVDMTGWSDFVFNKNYTLPTLEEVETHIKENGHLKDIPGEAEVKENGINLGEMDAKLLQKIEELTLYTISQQKLIEVQQKQLQSLQKQINELTQTKNK